jgi:hypothetical protein
MPTTDAAPRESFVRLCPLGCWAVFGLAEFDLLHLSVLPAWVRAVFAIVALLASMLWLAKIWDMCQVRFGGWQRRRGILDQLDKLDTREGNLLARQVAKDQQTLTAIFDDPVVVGLRTKGLLVLGTNAGNYLHYPHTIPEFVWAELRRRLKLAEQPEAPSGKAGSAEQGPGRVQRG